MICCSSARIGSGNLRVGLPIIFSGLLAIESSEFLKLRFCQSMMTELYRHIGADLDVPAAGNVAQRPVQHDVLAILGVRDEGRRTHRANRAQQLWRYA